MYPPLVPGGTHSLAEEGVGDPNSDEGTDTVHGRGVRHCGILERYVQYFVIMILERIHKSVGVLEETIQIKERWLGRPFIKTCSS